MKKFFDYDKEERAEWRRSPVTVAYLARLAEEQDGSRDECVIYCTNGGYNHGSVSAGKVEGFGRAITIAEES